MPQTTVKIEGRELRVLETRSRNFWLKTREPHINSTETSAIVGASPYCDLLELWGMKSGKLEAKALKPSERMEAGQYLEPSIAKFAGSKIGSKTKKFGAYLYDAEARIGASFDYELLDDITGYLLKEHGVRADGKPEPGWLLEIKNVDKWIFADNWAEGPPEHIEIQCQHQCEVAGRAGCMLAVLVGGNDLRLYPIVRNREMGKLIREHIQSFWFLVEQDDIPAHQLEKDAKILIDLYRKSEPGKTLERLEDDDLDDLLGTYKLARAKFALWDQVSKEIKAEVLGMIGQAEVTYSARFKLSAKEVAGQPPTVITADMVGQEIGGRTGHRGFTVSPADREAEKEKAKEKEAKAAAKEQDKLRIAAEKRVAKEKAAKEREQAKADKAAKKAEKAAGEVQGE